jgi:hypothetical protein
MTLSNRRFKYSHSYYHVPYEEMLEYEKMWVEEYVQVYAPVKQIGTTNNPVPIRVYGADVLKKISTWIRENKIKINWQYDYNTGKIVFFFEDIDQAMLFKLTWC